MSQRETTLQRLQEQVDELSAQLRDLHARLTTPVMRWNPMLSKMEPYNHLDDLGMGKRPTGDVESK